MADEAKSHSERRDELMALLLLLRRRMSDELGKLMIALGSGEISVQSFGDQALRLLARSHYDAAEYGRQLSMAESVGAEEVLAHAVAYNQAEFLAKFARDVREGKYGGGASGEALDEEKIQRRVDSYSLPLVGTANTAFVNYLPEDTLIYWRDTGDLVECSECPVLAAGSPYTPADLPTTPGSCDTPCVFNCRCQLETEAGDRGFQWDD